MSKRVKLYADDISDELYDALLKEFRNWYGDSMTFDNWEISAEVDSTEEEEATDERRQQRV